MGSNLPQRRIRTAAVANIKADAPAKTAGEEKPFSVEEKNPKADLAPTVREQPSETISPPSWTEKDVGQIRKLISDFREGEEPPAKLIEWIRMRSMPSMVSSPVTNADPGRRQSEAVRRGSLNDKRYTAFLTTFGAAPGTGASLSACEIRPATESAQVTVR
jgi:hypothetical protein